jgi:2'-5' RNA ligase
LTLSSFFIEFRLRGFARQYAVWVEERIHQEAGRLGIKHKRAKKFVSHITLFAPAKTRNLKHVIHEVKNVCSRYTLVPFRIGGFGRFLNTDANWLYIGVLPSPELETLRRDLSQALIKSDKIIHDTCEKYDLSLKYKFHSAVGKFDPKDRDKFEQILEFANNKCRLEDYKHHTATLFEKLANIVKKKFDKEQELTDTIYLYLLRVTVIAKRSHIYSEYDLMLKKLLSRREALSKDLQRKTIEKFSFLKK